MENKPTLNQLLDTLGIKREKKQENEGPSLIVRVTGDTNDADYATEECVIYLDTPKGIKDAKEMIDVIRDAASGTLFDPHTDETEPTPKWREYFLDQQCLPSDEYGGCHAITDVDIFLRYDGVLYPIEFPT